MLKKYVCLFLLFGSLEAADLPTLTVRGEATLYRPADQIQFTIGLTTEAPNANVALEKNSQQMKQVIDSLLASGLTREEFQTDRFQIYPNYSTRPKSPPLNWHPTIIGHTVRNQIRVKTGKLTEAGHFIDAAVRSGSNQVGSLVYQLEDPLRYRKESIKEASLHALQDARDLAEASGVRLVEIYQLTLDDVQMQPRFSEARTFYMKADASTSLEEGDVPIRATVTVVYRISEK